MRSPEDREPKRDVCEPVQEPAALVYPLVVRLAPPYAKRTLIIRHYEDGRADDWTIRIEGRSLT